MNHIYTDKQTNTSSWAGKTAISIALAASLLVIQGTALADNGRGKAKGHGIEYSTISQGHKVHHGKHATSSHHRHNMASHKGHMKKSGHGKWHGDSGQGKHGHHHDNHHRHKYVQTTRVLIPYHHVHRHSYHDPRISIGVHLGHFDLYFED
jgi:hypothetical protein